MYLTVVCGEADVEAVFYEKENNHPLVLIQKLVSLNLDLANWILPVVVAIGFSAKNFTPRITTNLLSPPLPIKEKSSD